jgi:aldose 1-epimerase
MFLNELEWLRHLDEPNSARLISAGLSQMIRWEMPAGNLPALHADLSALLALQHRKNALHFSQLVRILRVMEHLSCCGEPVRMEVPVPSGFPSTAKRAIELLTKTMEQEDWTLGTLADALHINPAYLVRVFHKTIGMSPMRYLSNCRAQLAATLLLSTDLPVSKIGIRVGWPEPKKFARSFKRHLGRTACEYRKTMRVRSILFRNHETGDNSVIAKNIRAIVPTCGIRTGHWEAEFAPQHGGQLLRLRHLPDGHEVLHYPETAGTFSAQPERHGVPVLFPPNRIADGRFIWRGREYRLPLNEAPPRNNHIHGIVLRAPWDINEIPSADSGHKQVALTFQHDKTRQTFDDYPHEFLITITWEFAPRRVTQKIRIENLDTDNRNQKIPMPFGLGFHTAFRLPSPETGATRLRVTASAQGHWELDPVRRLPTGAIVPWRKNERYHTPEGQLIDARHPLACHCPAISRQTSDGQASGGQAFRGAQLDFPEKNLRLTYEIGEEFGHWFLWTPPDDTRVLCIEPMTWIVNAPNMPLPDAVTGLLSLNAGSAWETFTRITLQTARPQPKQTNQPRRQRE